MSSERDTSSAEDSNESWEQEYGKGGQNQAWFERYLWRVEQAGQD